MAEACSCGHVFWQGVMVALLPSMGVLLYLLWNAPDDKDQA